MGLSLRALLPFSRAHRGTTTQQARQQRGQSEGQRGMSEEHLIESIQAAHGFKRGLVEEEESERTVASGGLRRGGRSGGSICGSVGGEGDDEGYFSGGLSVSGVDSDTDDDAGYFSVKAEEAVDEGAVGSGHGDKCKHGPRRPLSVRIFATRQPTTAAAKLPRR